MDSEPRISNIKTGATAFEGLTKAISEALRDRLQPRASVPKPASDALASFEDLLKPSKN